MSLSPFRLLVVGDFMLDYYYWGISERMSPEAPVPILAVERETWSLGGAGNVVKNLLALGADVDVCTVLGQDAGGDLLERELQAKGVGISALHRLEGRQTSIKNRLIAGHQQMLRFDKESKDPLSSALADELLKTLSSVVSTYDALILSDYAKGVLTPSFTQGLISLGREAGIPVYVDPKGHNFTKYKGATLMTPNRKELHQAAPQANTLPEAAEWLYQELALDAMVVTLSEAGIGIFDGDWEVVPTSARAVFDVTGAGDTALAALALALLSGQSLRDAAHFANAAAAVVIGKLGSETATLTEIEHFLNSLY